MPRVYAVHIPLRGPAQIQQATLTISSIPSTDPPLLWDFRQEPKTNDALEDLRVLEDEEYVYLITPENLEKITTDRPELFMPDYRHGRSGRFRPGLNVGELPVRFFSNGSLLGNVTFEVLSKKISYLSDYQSMLRSIATYLAEIIAERFSPALHDFSPLESRSAVTLYQQFAFIRAFLSGEEFREAIRKILTTPDQHWARSDEIQPLSKGIRRIGDIAKQLSNPGPRQPNPGLSIPSPTLPMFVRGQTFTEDVDTPENRFIFHILQYWLELATLVRTRICGGQTASSQRGVREADEVIAILEQILAARVFRKLGKLGYIPSGSTVLTRKEGYREVYRVFLQAQLAAQISWDGAQDVYGAGKKNVALLYEYWVLLTLASIISDLCLLKPLNIWSLVKQTSDGLSLNLRQGNGFVLQGGIERRGQNLNIELFYNRSFKQSTDLQDGSWTREMAPDFSLRIRKLQNLEECVWLHFDAKYRVDTITDLFGPNILEGDDHLGGGSLHKPPMKYKREDLLKMHAYKDAVRRSNGAFILYPGTKNELFKQFQEIVPGIGAFALRPSEQGPEGAEQVKQFVSDVIETFAAT